MSNGAIGQSRTPQTHPNPQIPGQLDNLDKVLEEHHQAIRELLERLEPIREPRSAEETTGVDPPEGHKIFHRISTQVRKVKIMTANLRELLGEIEV